MLDSVFLVRTAVHPRVTWKGVSQDGFDIYFVLCYGCKNVWILPRFAQCNERESTTRQTSASKTFENVEDGLVRWSPSAVVECGALAVTA